ncbi:pentapeptide repeat-containing protein [Streptomyces sp. NPDC050400]|uniref:pentapeptide repeat-containing protein n=1 Tax=Streptomyces sp. NPDC050400 TaxID=3365610 RepID=UPI0037AA79FD
MSDEQPAMRRPWWHWALAAAGTAVFIVLLIWGPWWIEGHHLKDGNGELVSSAGIVVTGFRTMLAAGAFTATGLWYTHRSHQETEKLFDHTREKDREQADLTREGQVTGRYVKAIKLLASDKLHERLGGIYRLERIMVDSERDHGTVIEVLSAYVRSESNKQRGVTEPQWEAIQAAVTVLGRRDYQPADPEVDLQNSYLPGLDLHGDWMSVNFMRADLANARFTGSNLGGAQLQGALLVDAWPTFTSCAETRFDGADLTGANLTGAVGLEEAQLVNAWIDSTTQLPANLSRLPSIGARISEYHQKGK